MPTRGVLSRGRSVSYDFGRIRDGILAAVKSHAATGVAVAVTHQGRIIWEEGFGWANREADTKVSEHTPFCLASITKPFTTTAMMTLVAAERISLDDSANKYLDRKSRLRGNAEAATIRLLGAHAAGLPSMFEMYSGTDDARQPSVFPQPIPGTQLNRDTPAPPAYSQNRAQDTTPLHNKGL